jgi:DNA topoisomerase-1
MPTPLGDTVAKLLVRVFPELFDPEFTSRMEGELDRVEEGTVPWRDVLGEFYPPFLERLERGKASSDDILKEILEAEGEVCEKCGSPMLVKWNRFGRFLGCSGYPECRNTRSMAGAGDLSVDSDLGKDPATGEVVYLKNGPYGPYVQLGEKGEDGTRPRRTSLPAGKEPGTVELEYALQLLSLPRVFGADPESGKPVKAGLGRYGPYVERSGVFRSLKDPEQLFTVTLEEAVDLLSRQSGPAVLKELGVHPESGKPLQLLDGRYGPYVTDGEANASIPKDEDPEAITLEDALSLLAKAPKRKGRRGGSAAGGKKAGGAKKGAAAAKSGKASAPKKKATRKSPAKGGKGRAGGSVAGDETEEAG